MTWARSLSSVVPIVARESLYVGVDIGKSRHIAGFISTSLLCRHTRYEGCPVLAFEQSREGFRLLVDRIRDYIPLEQCFVLVEQTGHHHLALVQYLQELEVSVYMIHVQSRPKGMLKTAKRDALGLANHLYNQLEKGIQFAGPLQLARRVVPPTEAAMLLRGVVRHRYELVQEATRRKNKLAAICDELFPELTHIYKNPNATAALALRQRFPTPHAVATASQEELRAVRVGTFPSEAKLAQLRQLAEDSIGSKDVGRQRGLVLEQRQLITELQLFQSHLEELENEMVGILASARGPRYPRLMNDWSH